ncbi:LOW QUALITY PROTEIN: V-set and immunoglobulin domain-containing protein 4 [Cricetulus griseus]|uniref:LOW QUALITY PROTEIN: V-set and immunoglobulin domain-containing protein 4 n=1 Tax=Cricetulus griseus TaxID=10029 RepID=UPI000F74342E|nr:LOW QUALITY PROTEIN: V-set and immunoglobulin domain-containing protein 4 [Cricetulus griseus]
MEERTTLAPHKMEISLVLLFLGHLMVLTHGHPILKAPETVIGTWKRDLTLPCIYVPLRGYSQVLVKWLVQRGSDPVTIFLRDSSGDHIQQAKYRGRLKVSHKIPGDVSLQLNVLQMDDRSHYTCEVTWQTPDGNQVMRYKIIELRVQKYSSNPRIINTEPLPTVQSSLEAVTSMKSTCDWTTTVSGKLEETTAASVNGKRERATPDPVNEKTIAGPRKNLTISAIICIAALCCIAVVTMAYVMFCCKTFQQEHVYEVSRVCARETSNSEETTFANGYFNVAPDSHALVNEYSDEPCLEQEYQTTIQSTMTIPACCTQFPETLKYLLLKTIASAKMSH